MGVHLECHTRFFFLLLMKLALLNLFVGIAISRKGNYNCALDKIFWWLRALFSLENISSLLSTCRSNYNFTWQRCVVGDEQAVVGGVDEEDDVVETELEPLQVYHDEDEMCQPNWLEDQGRECFLFLKGSLKRFFDHLWICFHILQDLPKAQQIWGLSAFAKMTA